VDLLIARELAYRFRDQKVAAVSDVSVSLALGETLGLVGTSGSGKSTLARLLLHLIRPQQGSVIFEGTELSRLGASALRRLRARIGLVQQDPLGALDPRLSAADSIAEPLIVHGFDDRAARVAVLLDQVGLTAAEGERRPIALSGGQRQRVCIARALATRPVLLVLDEPVAALDVSVQAQVLTLLRELQAEQGYASLLISHDMNVVRQMAGRVAVMQAGRIAELGATEKVFTAPQTEMTRTLLNAVPTLPPEAPRVSLWRKKLLQHGAPDRDGTA
jgi:ABC-type glutathione transport system ATPase component